MDFYSGGRTRIWSPDCDDSDDNKIETLAHPTPCIMRETTENYSHGSTEHVSAEVHHNHGKPDDKKEGIASES